MTKNKMNKKFLKNLIIKIMIKIPLIQIIVLIIKSIKVIKMI
jgi:hypothetical protein